MTPHALASAANPAIDYARLLMRGAARLLFDLGYNAIPEFSLASARRADLFGVGRKGEIAIVEVKSCLTDFRTDGKWPEYREYCDRLYFAVSSRFPHDLIPGIFAPLNKINI